MQSDPTTTKSSNPKDVLARNEQRVLLHLIPSPALVHVAKALMDGARKYGPYNWREEGVGATTYVSAAQRHIAAWLDGEEDAPDSKVHHLGHAVACLAIILDAIEVGNLVDDRPVSAPTAALLEREKYGAATEPRWDSSATVPIDPTHEAADLLLKGETIGVFGGAEERQLRGFLEEFYEEIDFEWKKDGPSMWVVRVRPGAMIPTDRPREGFRKSHPSALE